jgi:hypothetical protein
MNDGDLITAVRETVTGAHLRVPVEQIVSRSRAIRARRRMTGAAGLLAVGAGAALAVTALVPPGHPAGHQTTVQLAAWTVTRQADGSIDVTVRGWRDPARLQATLRAAGLPVSVTPPPNPACRPYPASRGLLGAIAHFQTPAQTRESQIVFVIHPGALPSGAGLSISIAPAMHRPPPGMKRVARAVPPVPVGLVHASQQCTGS